eukprot:Clim_evm9s203 gene=Clim_evmTU9s203
MTADQFLLFGMGNPLLDVSAEVDEEYLKKYDLEANNAILAEDKHKPMYTEMAEKYNVQYIPGGATQNAIRVAQWMLKKPNQTCFVGCIGKDKFGAEMKAKLEADGVQDLYLEDEKTETGTCGVLITGENRSLVANLAAANEYKKDHLVSSDIWKHVQGAKIFYVSSFFLTACAPAAMEVAKHAAEANKLFTMNLSAPFLIEFFKDPMMEIFPYMDIVFGNETEAATFGKVHGLGDDVTEIAKKVQAMDKVNKDRKRIVVFTQGSQATVVVDGDGNATEYPVQVLEKSQLVDTNGAGDAFVGGFLAKLAEGKDMKDCVEAGHWAARVIIQRSGCTFPDTCDYEA